VRKTLVGGSRKMVSYDDLEPSEKIRVYDKGITLKDANAPADGNGKHAMLVGYRSGDVWAPQIALTEALSIEARHFVDCIANNLTPIADGQGGLRVVQIVEAATSP
jgi:predicted dehydrogenase